MGPESGVTLAFVLRMALLATVAYLSLMSGMVLMLAAAPAFTRRVRGELAVDRDVGCAWGFAFLGALVLAFLLLSRVGPAGFVAALVLAAGGVAVALMGVGVFAIDLGRKIMRLHGGREATELAAFMIGASVILWSTLLPLFGWIFFSYFLSTGVGAVLRGVVTALAESRGSEAPARAPSPR